MLFSIIVPVYNVEKYLRQCVDSILFQTYSDFELILVDDGSLDTCLSICDDYAEKDSRVKVIHKKNGGSTSARKIGINNAEGDYVLFVDSDDFIEESTLQLLHQTLEINKCDVICFGHKTFPDSAKSHGLILYRDGAYSKEQMEKEIFPTLITGETGRRFPPSIWGKAFRRDLVMPILTALPNNIIIGEDSCVVYPSLYGAESIYILHEQLYYYRVENASLTRNYKKAFSWEEPFLRADFYLQYMSEELFGEQIARITAHSIFNVAISVIKTKKYKEAKKEICLQLSQGRAVQILAKAKFKKSKKERLALYCLIHRQVFLMKLIAKIL